MFFSYLSERVKTQYFQTEIEITTNRKTYLFKHDIWKQMILSMYSYIFSFLVNVLDITAQFEFQNWVENFMHVKLTWESLSFQKNN